MSVSLETLAALAARTGYSFNNSALLLEALSHPSSLQDNPSISANNQRLEFLGDSVIHLILTETLFRLYPNEREGALSRFRSTLTNGRFLSGLARDLGLDKAIILSSAEEQTGGRAKDSALEDVFEAYVGAMYLDGDLFTTRQQLLSWYGSIPERLGHLSYAENPKGRLQELVQPEHGNDALRYELMAAHGAAHQREFEVELFLKDRRLGTGRGPSKKLAEEEAARMALKDWGPGGDIRS